MDAWMRGKQSRRCLHASTHPCLRADHASTAATVAVCSSSSDFATGSASTNGIRLRSDGAGQRPRSPRRNEAIAGCEPQW